MIKPNVPIRVLGLDTALTNIGWQVWDVDPTAPTGDRHPLGRFVAGNTITNRDANVPLVQRLVTNQLRVQEVLEWACADLVVIEGPLTHGTHRSPSGLAMYALVASLLAPGTNRDYRPGYVVTIHPSRLHSLIHGKASQAMNARALKTLYRDLVPGSETVSGRSEHEIDAYFLAYFGTRFVMVVLESIWPRAILSSRELDAYYYTSKTTRQGAEVSTAMCDQGGDSWWKISSTEFPRCREIPENSQNSIPSTGDSTLDGAIPSHTGNR